MNRRQFLKAFTITAVGCFVAPLSLVEHLSFLAKKDVDEVNLIKRLNREIVEAMLYGDVGKNPETFLGLASR